MMTIEKRLEALEALLLGKKKKPAKKATPPAAPRQLTELEQVQRNFEWLRSRGAVTVFRIE